MPSWAARFPALMPGYTRASTLMLSSWAARFPALMPGSGSVSPWISRAKVQVANQRPRTPRNPITATWSLACFLLIATSLPACSFYIAATSAFNSASVSTTISPCEFPYDAWVAGVSHHCADSIALGMVASATFAMVSPGRNPKSAWPKPIMFTRLDSFHSI